MHDSIEYHYLTSRLFVEYSSTLRIHQSVTAAVCSAWSCSCLWKGLLSASTWNVSSDNEETRFFVVFSQRAVFARPVELHVAGTLHGRTVHQWGGDRHGRKYRLAPTDQ